MAKKIRSSFFSPFFLIASRKILWKERSKKIIGNNLCIIFSNWKCEILSFRACDGIFFVCICSHVHKNLVWRDNYKRKFKHHFWYFIFRRFLVISIFFWSGRCISLSRINPLIYLKKLINMVCPYSCTESPLPKMNNHYNALD